MKRLRSALFLAALSWPVVALPAEPSGWDQVRYTIHRYVDRNANFYPAGNAPGSEQAIWDKARTRGAPASLIQAASTAGMTGQQVAVCYNDDKSTCYDYAGNGGSFGGGGATAAWDPCDFDWQLDAQGNLIIPAMPLVGGGVMTPDDTIYYSFKPTGGKEWMQDSRSAASLWAIHKANLAYRSTYTDKRGWIGAQGYSWKGSSYWTLVGYSVAYYDSTGTLVPSYPLSSIPVAGYTRINGTGGSGYLYQSSTYTTAIPCPQSATGAGDFHFYVDYNAGSSAAPKTSNCTYYHPNTAVSPSGYYANPQTVILAANIRYGFANTWLADANCKIPREVIRRIVDGAAKSLDVAAPSATLDDVPGDAPANTYGDDTPATNYTPPNPQPSPTPIPTPTPTATPTGSTEPPPPANPVNDLAEPVLPELPDWFPDLPSFTLQTSATCPTYGGDVFGHQVVLDIHCPLIEDNRAAIGALMLVFFTLGALVVVLKA